MLSEQDKARLDGIRTGNAVTFSRAQVSALLRDGYIAEGESKPGGKFTYSLTEKGATYLNGGEQTVENGQSNEGPGTAPAGGFTIFKAAPPPITRQRGQKYPFEQMTVGDAFFVPNDPNDKTEDGKQVDVRKRLSSPVSQATEKYRAEGRAFRVGPGEQNGVKGATVYCVDAASKPVVKRTRKKKTEGAAPDTTATGDATRADGSQPEGQTQEAAG
jgi:hypothetical protein